MIIVLSLASLTEPSSLCFPLFLLFVLYFVISTTIPTVIFCCFVFHGGFLVLSMVCTPFPKICGHECL